ncbi:MAG: hypothetical protein H6R10_1626 [Rhodocyclaceae bacterium]|nr:hypothetical protein [Rhodocyclaceae bacterium]
MKASSFARLYRDFLLPRSVLLPFLVTRIALEILNLFTFFRFIPGNRRPTRLCLEAGIKGWELIEYKELFASAQDFVGAENTRKIEIDRNQSYVGQVLSAVRKHRPTHYVYDSRTGSENWLLGMLQAFQISLIFQYHGVVPICVLTDLPIRAWRAQTAMVSAKRGIVVSLMSPRDVDPIFPHGRIIGPLMMAFSEATLERLIEMDRQTSNKFADKTLVFSGSLYEPRASLLNEIRRGLADHQIVLELKGRQLGSQRFSDEDYWHNLSSSAMVITTANLSHQKGVDWPWVSHLIYRYLEVPAAGSVLVAQEVPSLRRYLVPDRHFIAYSTPEEAVRKISHYWNHPSELEEIARAGREKVRSVIRANMYWICVDTALQKYSLL